MSWIWEFALFSSKGRKRTCIWLETQNIHDYIAASTNARFNARQLRLYEDLVAGGRK